tara:strand:+ start:195 stop:644 length:450 start_codon:yes stop_codon:yes gene_type:complete
MANTQAMCTSFKVDLLNGLHAFSSAYRTVDVFKAALFTAASSLDAATTSYTTATTEVSGANYSAGGITVTNATAPTSSGTTAYWNPSASFTYTNVTLATAFDAVLVYNSTATGKNAVSVHTFGSQTVTAGTFILTMPASDATNALERIA